MPRSRRFIAQAALLTLAITSLAAPATGATTASLSDRPPDGRKGGTVTLITGDKVTITPIAGSDWNVQVTPAKGTPAKGPNPSGYLRSSGPKGVTVIPVEAAPLVRSGVLDKAFFDITGLIRQGLDDAHTNEVPILVQGPTAKTLAAPLGRITRQLPKARLTAVATSKAKAATAFASLKANASAKSNNTKIWLNGRAKPSLDVSAKQVGAPTAWQAGLIGADVKVAVLDGGYDAAHPDLAGVVKSEKDFTGGTNGTKDDNGHGTHVASTIAGRGTASGGKYTGVAKGADLLVGKICAEGYCPFDAIIAGMQWAADSGARVINMSIGASPTDGTDPVSAELNRISAASGALFVVAAGNDGPFGQVSSPASADSALAVASVTKQDELSEFSSVGPRVGDYAMKPDVAAPGSDIVAARAAGTLAEEAVDANYARLSGTSMATPHVAGAAAILAGQHPDWKAPQLKAALMSSAHPVNATVYQQGAGRIDLARAIKQDVTADPASLSFGGYTWPHDNAQPRTKRATFRNGGSSAITLDLKLEGVPAGLFALAVDRMTIPAGGKASIDVTVDPAKAPDGTYGGRLVASGNDQVVQVPIGVFKEGPHHHFDLRVIDRDGRTLPVNDGNSVALVQNLDDANLAWLFFGSEKVRLPAGRYSVSTFVGTRIAGRATKSLTGIAELVELTADKTVTLDARKGVRMNLKVEGKDAQLQSGAVVMYGKSGEIGFGSGSGLSDEQYAVPTQDQYEDFVYSTRAQIERAAVQLKVTAPDRFELPVRWLFNSTKFVGTKQLDLVDVGQATPAEIAAKDVRGKLALFTLMAENAEPSFDERIRQLAAAGAVAVLFNYSDPVGLSTDAPVLPTVITTSADANRLADGAKVTLTGNPASPYRYELAIPEVGGIPAKLDYTIRDRDLGAVDTKYHAFRDAGARGWLWYEATLNGRSLDSFITPTEVGLPLRRTEFYSANGIEWRAALDVFNQSDAGPSAYHFLSAKRTVYQAGARTQVDWNKAVFGPVLSVPRYYGESPVRRDGDRIDVALPLFSDSAGHVGEVDTRGFADKGTTSLYRNGQLVKTEPVSAETAFDVPKADGDYRLATEVRRDHPAWPSANRIAAEWNFRSGHTEKAAALPLLAIAFNPDVDLYNRATGGRSAWIGVQVHRQVGSTGAKPKLTSVEVSYDEGATWHRAPLRQTVSGWAAYVVHPKSGTVSLRAAASDADGNSVGQTTVRAYGLK